MMMTWVRYAALCNAHIPLGVVVRSIMKIIFHKDFIMLTCNIYIVAVVVCVLRHVTVNVQF